MSLRPVDLQVMIPRTTEVARNQAGETQRSNANAAVFQNQLDKQAEAAKSTVTQTVKPDEQVNVNKDGRGNQGYSGKQQKKKEEEKPKKRDGGSLVDISI